MFDLSLHFWFCYVSHSLDFSDCFLIVLCLSALISCKLVIRSISFIRFGGGEGLRRTASRKAVFFHLEGPNTSCFPFSVKLAALDDHCPAVSSHYGLQNWYSKFTFLLHLLYSCCSVAKLCPTLWDCMDCSTPGFPLLNELLEFAQTHHVHWVGAAAQPSHPLLPPSPPALNLSQHQGLFQWVRSSHQVANWSFSISPCNEYSGLISFRIDWFDLLAVQGILKSLLQHHSLKASVLWCSAFFMDQISHPYMTAGKTVALTRQTCIGKIMSLLFNMLSKLVIIFLPRSKPLLISWLQSPSAVILEPPPPPQKNKVCHCFHCFPIYLPWSDGTRCHDLSFLNVEL